MATLEAVDAVNQSYGRCIMAPDFYDAFYDTFVKSSDRIAPLFKNTDLARQKQIMRGTITYVIMYAKNPQMTFASDKLKSVGDVHSRSRINVPPDLYPFWADSLIKAVKTFDKEFTPALEQQWRQTLAPAIELLKTHY